MTATQPFRVDLPPAVLDDLRERLSRTRWPDALEGAGWRLGTDPAFLRRLCEHWAERFDWRAQEARLNALDQVRVVVDGVGLHAVHARSGAVGAVPLLLTNGWPSSIFEYLQIIPRLTAAGFDVVAPALPGYGFSDRPTSPGTGSGRIADLFAGLMTTLGHPRFFMHGSDIGAGVTERMRRRHPDRLIGVHFHNVYSAYPRPEDPTPEERAYAAAVAAWQEVEGTYAHQHRTRPQTLAYGLNDSPVGLAGWIGEKFHVWSDGDPEALFGLDGLCANLTLYWATQTIGSSMRLYAETAAERTADPLTCEPGTVPAGVMVSPRDILPAPRIRAERNVHLLHWTEAPRGGHFPAWEAPDLLAADLRAFADTTLAGSRPQRGSGETS